MGARIFTEDDAASQINSASIYVEPTAATPARATALSSALTGGSIVSATDVQNSGAPAVDAFLASVSSQRSVWVSNAFVAAYPKLHSLYVQAANARQSKWKRVAEKQVQATGRQGHVETETEATPHGCHCAGDQRRCVTPSQQVINS